MQRQSLGSPAAKQPPPAQGAGKDDDDGKKKRKRKVGAGVGLIELEEAGEEAEVISPERPTHRALAVGAWGPSAERTIHLIPVLTLLCLLVLYLCSHDPNITDMTDLEIGSRLFDHTVSGARFGRAVSAAAVRNHRSLKELERLRGQNHSSSRKLGKRRTAAYQAAVRASPVER